MNIVHLLLLDSVLDLLCFPTLWCEIGVWLVDKPQVQFCIGGNNSLLILCTFVLICWPLLLLFLSFPALCGFSQQISTYCKSYHLGSFWIAEVGSNEVQILVLKLSLKVQAFFLLSIFLPTFLTSPHFQNISLLSISCNFLESLLLQLQDI